ncbi:hypothetical protein LEP1GSC070_2965 [Leptospira santarosai str. AIM]|nr:hypothetical protein LEP1GSC070_2965 [Leptospira santarosai str. AIM]
MDRDLPGLDLPVNWGLRDLSRLNLDLPVNWKLRDQNLLGSDFRCLGFCSK